MFFSTEKLIYPIKKTCDIVLKSEMPMPLDQTGQYTLSILPVSGLRLRDLSESERQEVLSIPLTDIKLEPKGETLTVTAVFPQEDRYVLKIAYNGKEIELTEVYALADDLFECNPYKGDTHLHSFLSSHGKSGGNESPEYVAAACRWRGYDFVAITDHHEYVPSQRCKAFYEPLNMDYLILSGEEIHSPGNPVHVVSLGGSASVNEWAEKQREEYDKAVAAKLETVSDSLGKQDRYSVAASLAVFDKIKEYGGVSILCHPFWVRGTNKLLHETQDVTDTLFDSPEFDAFELMAGGAYVEGSQVQISYCMGKKQLPVLGCSDSHATSRKPLSLDTGYYSIVFASELTEEGILEAIRKGMCVAACKDRLVGPYRLVRYAYFAMQYLFPQHDMLCERQGQVFMKLASARPGDDFLLSQLDPVRDLPSKYFESIKA